jgi:ABC-type iron transport system FetAB ATPase subunit
MFTHLSLSLSLSLSLFVPDACYPSADADMYGCNDVMTTGRVLIDGVDLKSINVRHWREQVALVSQEPLLFAGTSQSSYHSCAHMLTC